MGSSTSYVYTAVNLAAPSSSNNGAGGRLINVEAAWVGPTRTLPQLGPIKTSLRVTGENAATAGHERIEYRS